MNVSTHRVVLDIHRQTTQAHLAAKKGDTARRIIVSLSDGGVPYVIGKDCYAAFMAQKPDGNVLYNSCSIQGNQIIYDFTEQTACAAGRMLCEFRLYSAEDALITSPRISIIVSGTVYEDSEVESTPEFEALSKAMTEVAELKANGLRGEPGPQGPQGPQGPAGTPGEPGTLIVHTQGNEAELAPVGVLAAAEKGQNVVLLYGDLRLTLVHVDENSAVFTAVADGQMTAKVVMDTDGMLSPQTLRLASQSDISKVAEDAKTLRVNVSITSYAPSGMGIGSADKTPAEIAAAVNSGRSVCAVDGDGVIYSLAQCDPECVFFLANVGYAVFILSVYEEGVMLEECPLVTPEQIPTKVSQLENDGGFLSMDNCVVYGANLASLGEVVGGYFVSPTTGNPAIAPNSTYTTIPIPDGKELTVGFGCHIYAFEASNTGGVSFWDKDMNNLGVFDVANYKIAYTHNGYPCATIPIPDGAAFVRCTVLLWDSATKTAKWDATYTLFVAMGNAEDAQNPRISTICGYPVCSKKETAEKKKWAVIGDSLTAVNTTAANKYHDYVASELGLLVNNRARSGAGFTSGTVFSTQIAELANVDCDVITIFTSGNDCDNDPPLGAVTDTGSDTLCGVINTTLDELFALKPFVSVGIITSCPWKWFMPSTPGNLMENYNNAIMEIARRRGIPVLDLYHSSNMRPDDEGFRVKFYNENGVQDNGVHPNSEGHKILAAPIREFVRSLIRP